MHIYFKETSSTVEKCEGPLWKVLFFLPEFSNMERRFTPRWVLKSEGVVFVVFVPQSSRFLGWRYHWVVLENGNLSWYLSR
jgi:hypothetical protein